MSIGPDPYRVLGISRGASADDIRRAYRRLVKENHPDSAGEGALPRFLAIQAAYEALGGGSATGRAAGRSPAPRPRPGDPWSADPERARATREGSRRAGRSTYGQGQPRTADGQADRGAPGAGRDGGSTAAPGRARPRQRPSGPDQAGPGAAGSTSGANGRNGAKPGSSRAPGDRPRREGRKRAPNKATLGSTSYDAAADEPFEPEWSGGTWYGASSGTYWTINPKEYADPRKHGPEYQRRARRRTSAGSGGGLPGDGDGPAAAPTEDAAWNGDATDPTGPPIDDEADNDDGARRRSPSRAGASGRSQSSATASEWQAASWDAASAEHLDESGERTAGMDPFAAAAQLAMGLSGTPRGFMARVALALLGWPAIGLALTTTAGEITGCGRFAATCIDLFGVWTWLAQLVVIATLLALPSVAALSVVGSLAALAASVPTAVILSASGGSREPAASAAILGVVLVVSYAGGILVTLARRRRLSGLP